MPSVITPSARTASLWRGAAGWVLRMEAAALILSALGLPLMTAFITQYLDAQAMPEAFDTFRAEVRFRGPATASFIGSRIAGCILPLLIVAIGSVINLFYVLPSRALHPAATLVNSIVMFFLSMLATILTADYVSTTAGTECSTHLGLKIAPGIIATLYTVLLCILFVAYSALSAVAMHRLRLYGPARGYAQSEYASEYSSAFAGSVAGGTKHIKLWQTPTRPMFSPIASISGSHVTGPINREEEEVGGPSLPSLPARASTVRSVRVAPRTITMKSVKSIKSAPLLGPKTPRSPLSPHRSTREYQSRQSLAQSDTSTVADAASRQRQLLGTSTMAEQDTQETQPESPVEGLIDRSQQSHTGNRQRGLSLEGKAKRELVKMKVERLDVERAQEYKMKQVGQARAVGAEEEMQ